MAGRAERAGTCTRGRGDGRLVSIVRQPFSFTKLLSSSLDSAENIHTTKKRKKEKHLYSTLTGKRREVLLTRQLFGLLFLLFLLLLNIPNRYLIVVELMLDIFNSFETTRKKKGEK